MNKALLPVVVVCCCLVASTAGLGQNHGNLPGPPFPREVATGDFFCSVSTVDPPAGDGITRAGGFVSFTGTTGISSGGEIGEGVGLGEGDGLEGKCEALTEQMASLARALGCTAGATRFREIIGGNFRDKEWSFDVVCSDSHDRVMNAIGTMLATIETSSMADGATRTTHTTDVFKGPESPVSVRDWPGDSSVGKGVPSNR